MRISHTLYSCFIEVFLTFTATNAQPSPAKTRERASMFQKVEVERLADLNIARASHSILCLDGELTVMGGHTAGFMPTSTIEYYRDGQWHVVPSVYQHDGGVATPLPSGKVLFIGGFEQPLGIGQNYYAELYDPASHTSNGFGCLEYNRSFPSAEPFGGNRVLIAGNWYHYDGMEIFDGNKSFVDVKKCSVNRSRPFIFRTAVDDAIVLGSVDSYDHQLTSTIADCLSKDTLLNPMPKGWTPLNLKMEHHSADSFVGDTVHGDYTYLMPVMNDKGQVAIASVINGRIQLLPDSCMLPMSSSWGTINYFSDIIVDRNAARAYIVGYDSTRRIYVACRSLTALNDTSQVRRWQGRLTMFFTDPLEHAAITTPVLTAEGNLLLAGGLFESNFNPSAAVYLLRLSNLHEDSDASCWSIWLFVAFAVVLLVALLCVITLQRHRKTHRNDSVNGSISCKDESEALETSGELMERLNRMMEEEELFKKSGLKLSETAARMKVNSHELADCLLNEKGCTFAQYVNGWRIDYVKRLLCDQPNVKISSIYQECGFSNEPTFFRIFKTFTGTTPRDWIASQQDSDTTLHP